MRQDSIYFLVLFATISILAGGGYFYYTAQNPPPSPVPPGAVCTQDVKLCPDGSYVGRLPPLCQFANCPKFVSPPPSVNLQCKSNADCPSQNYLCEATEGIGTIYPHEENQPDFTITKGICKIKVGNRCSATNQCAIGLICHENICIESVGRACAGPNDYTCPNGYRCAQSCGPPVPREGDPPPPYFCELNETADKPKNCPICLASNTNIATPMGEINVKNIAVGMSVWSQNKHGEKIKSIIIAVSHTPVPKTHRIVHLVLSDGREVWVSPDHPTVNGVPIQQLRAGDPYNDAFVRISEIIRYWDQETHDILPDSDTGYYWANGVLLGSSLMNAQFRAQ